MPKSTLYVVATPLGNLEDFSPRAVRVLREVSAIAAEDTRHSGKLMQHFGINTPMFSLHDYNEAQKLDSVIARLAQGDDLALISDAGTPLISDPGYHLVRAVREQGYPIITIPGACAVIAALSVLGLPTDRFVFEGFLPAKTAARQKRLQALKDETRTLVFYESVHRIDACVEDMLAVLGAERQVGLAKELTKLHEESVVLPLAELTDWLRADPHRQQGEFVLVVHGAEAAPSVSEAEQLALMRILVEELPLKQAARLAAQFVGAKTNQLYQLGLKLSEQE